MKTYEVKKILCVFFILFHMSAITFGLEPWLHSADDSFCDSFIVREICNYIENSGSFRHTENLDITVKKLAKDRDFIIKSSANEFIIEDKNQGLAIRYFDPMKANTITSYANISKLKTKVITSNLHRQIVHIAEEKVSRSAAPTYGIRAIALDWDMTIVNNAPFDEKGQVELFAKILSGTIFSDGLPEENDCEEAKKILKHRYETGITIQEALQTAIDTGIKRNKLAPGKITVEQANKLRIDLIKKSFDEMAAKNPENLLMPGIEKLLNDLKNMGIQLFVVSRGTRENMLNQINRLNLSKYFTDVYADPNLDKSEILKKIANDIGTDISNVIMVGDLPATDIIPAQKVVAKTVGFALNDSMLESLKNSQPDVIITGVYPDAKDLLKQLPASGVYSFTDIVSDLANERLNSKIIKEIERISNEHPDKNIISNADNYIPGVFKIKEAKNVILSGTGVNLFGEYNRINISKRVSDLLDMIGDKEQKGEICLSGANWIFLKENLEKAVKNLFNSEAVDELTYPQFEELLFKLIGMLHPDLYADVKTESNLRGKEFYVSARKEIKSLRWPEALKKALVYSALGNGLEATYYDKSLMETSDIEKRITGLDDFLGTLLERMENKKGGTILYFIDNAGEIFTDLLVVELLVEKGFHVKLVAKESPASDDLTVSDVNKILSDLAAFGGDDYAWIGRSGLKVVSSGSSTPATDLNKIDPSLFNDTVLSIYKGGGNFYGTCSAVSARDSFHIFMLKEPLQNAILAAQGIAPEKNKKGTLVFLHRNKDSLPIRMSSLVNEGSVFKASVLGPWKLYIDRNREAFRNLLGKNKKDFLLRVPIEAVEAAGAQNSGNFLAALGKAPNAYIELYSSQGTGEITKDVYQKYGLSKKSLPETFKKTKETTITLFATAKDENLGGADIAARLGGLDVSIQDTILSPVGLERDATGLVRATIFGLKIMEIARQINESGEAVTKNQPFKDKLQLEILETVKNVYGWGAVKNFNITPDDIIALAGGTTNDAINALQKLIKLLPVSPIDTEELRKIYEHAREVVLSA